MNNAPNIALFSIITGLIFLTLDVYVLLHWRSFVKKNSMNPWWHRASWILAVVFLGLYVWLTARRHFFRMDGLDALLFGLATFWYLPKLPTAIVLIVRDLARGVRAVLYKLFSKPAEKKTDAVDNSRRAFVGKASWSMAAVPYILVGNGIVNTLYDFEVEHVDIVLPNLPRALDGIRIIQLSDIHAGSYPDHKPFQEAMRMVHEQRPDIVLITGDFVNAAPQELSVVARDLSKLSAPEGVYAILGNHDHYNSPADHQRVIRSIKQFGIDLMINENRRIGTGDASLVLAGIDNTGFRQNFGRLDKALRGAKEDDAIVLMAHDPTFWDKEVVGTTNVGLTLSGHTHGGQFGVRAFGYAWSPAQYVYKQWAGLYKTGSQQIYVNRGLGTVGPPLRIGIRPEITSITLRAQKMSERVT